MKEGTRHAVVSGGQIAGSKKDDLRINLVIYLYCCTVHFEDSPSITHQQMHKSYIIYCFQCRRVCKVYIPPCTESNAYTNTRYAATSL